MKRKLLLFGLLTIFSVTIFAKQVDENTAKLVGKNFLITNTNSQTLKSVTNLQLVYKTGSKNNNFISSNQETTFFYVFNTDLAGFVIVSGDDNVTPILGYSDRGSFDANNIPQNVAKWLESYKYEIRRIIEQNIQPDHEIIVQWQRLKNENTGNTTVKSLLSVNPLLQTHWNQSPYYNSLCPGGSVTGCVATAMAQIMKYWNYPATGSGYHSFNHQTYGTLSANFGSTTYQWSSMPNSVTSANNAVATLMYQVGVSVDMNYSPQVSGAYVISAQSPVTNCSEYALKTYFGYKSTLQGVQRANYNQTQWLTLLKTELDASRPVLYAGFGSGGGHCFVADGYDNNDFIHFNWGWGGFYDGYFQINALNPSGTGTGGGSGGYNSGHQAVIGIEPPAGNQTFNMALYNYVIPSAVTIYYGQAFSISTNIVNNGTNTFNGDYEAAIFDNANNFVNYVQILPGYTLQGGFTYTSNLVFSTTGLFSMLPGTYYAGIFYRPTGGNWVQVSNNGSYTNLVQMNVINPNDIELNSAITVTPGSVLIQGQSVSVNLNIVNDGVATFTGIYAVGLYNLDGTLAQTIGSLNESNGLPSSYTYLSPYLTFSTPSVTVSPGTYLLAVQHNPNNTGFQLTGSTYFQNPIKVTVVVPVIQPDIYEPDNTLSQSFNLPVNFSGNDAVINSTGSNCHITSDNDYYKIVLSPGYNYTITPRLHDSYNSGNGNTYTLDGLFSYSTDGTTWSETFDDIMPGNIVLNGGVTVYFHIAPYFAGETGTYLLSMTVNRISTVDISENQIGSNIKVYPNPAKDNINFDLNDSDIELQQIHLVSIQGQFLLSSLSTGNSGTFNLSLSDISAGIYFLQLHTSKGILIRKVTVTK